MNSFFFFVHFPTDFDVFFFFRLTCCFVSKCLFFFEQITGGISLQFVYFKGQRRVKETRKKGNEHMKINRFTLERRYHVEQDSIDCINGVLVTNSILREHMLRGTIYRTLCFVDIVDTKGG